MGKIQLPTRQETQDSGPRVSEWNQWEIERYKQDTEYRKTLTNWVMWTSVCWLAFVAIVLVLNSCVSGFLLSDVAISVLLGTTTANVLGLALIVLKGMFRNSE